MPKKTRLEKNLEGTQDIFGDLRKQSMKSGLSDDVFGFRKTIRKKTGKKKQVVKTPYGSFEV